MNKLLRALIAGYGAKKLGGGCFSTILIFFLIYWALGNCNSSSRTAPSRPASLIQERKVAANFGNTDLRDKSVFYMTNDLYPTGTFAVNK